MTTSTPKRLPSRTRRSPWVWAAAAVLLIAAGGGALAGIRHAQRQRLESRLLASLPNAVLSDPALVRFAVGQARPLFETHCAVCHGADMRGNSTIGAPNLKDSVWLYGNGTVYDIERTILYGVRSGLSKTHNVTDMPGYGLRGRLSSGQIDSLVQYLLKMNNRPHQAEGAEEGRALYYGPATCGDCHGSDARGDSDYGAPDLTVGVWNSGGDPQSLYRSIYFGRHRTMPAWIGKLSLEQIRALAVYVYAASHPGGAPDAGRESYAGGS
ncbi:MAG TPA: c-type cytochrome [Steroidobacteraceae bacterium]|nr:c-type cytochrome [Steroidobacteraceae bacterium]